MNILNYVNSKVHEGRPCTPPGKPLTLYHASDSFLHCCIESQGCRFSKAAGACVMCDYGIGKNLTPSELECALKEQLRPELPKGGTVLFGAYGSVLDEYEISRECLDVILNFASEYDLERIIFETHYSTVTAEKLRKIRSALGNKSAITIEMGYESCDEYILSNCLRKVMNLNELKNVMSLIHDEGMETSLNVFVGAPFISTREQTLTAVKSVEWAFSNGADDVVLFPANIKPFTLLFELYKAGHYSEVTHWQFIDVLNRIPEKDLNKVSFSWYGDRKNFYENNQYPLIPPKSCDKCCDKIFEFYRDFRSTLSVSERKQLLNNLINGETECECRTEYLHSFDCDTERLSQQQIEGIVKNVGKE